MATQPNYISTGIRLFCIILGFTFAGLFFTACSFRGVSERDLRRWIEEHPNFLSRDGQFAQINEIEILRRQTNSDERTDKIWLTVYANLGDTDFVLSYFVYFGRYNNEWHLRDFEPYFGITGNWEQSFLSEEEVLSIAKNAFSELYVFNNLYIETLI